jgi:hypothetical protein
MFSAFQSSSPSVSLIKYIAFVVTMANGVIVELGHNEFSTTTKSAFVISSTLFDPNINSLVTTLFMLLK